MAGSMYNESAATCHHHTKLLMQLGSETLSKCHRWMENNWLELLAGTLAVCLCVDMALVSVHCIVE